MLKHFFFLLLHDSKYIKGRKQSIRLNVVQNKPQLVNLVFAQYRFSKNRFLHSGKHSLLFSLFEPGIAHMLTTVCGTCKYRSLDHKMQRRAACVEEGGQPFIISRDY